MIFFLYFVILILILYFSLEFLSYSKFEYNYFNPAALFLVFSILPLSALLLLASLGIDFQLLKDDWLIEDYETYLPSLWMNTVNGTVLYALIIHMVGRFVDLGDKLNQYDVNELYDSSGLLWVAWFITLIIAWFFSDNPSLITAIIGKVCQCIYIVAILFTFKKNNWINSTILLSVLIVTTIGFFYISESKGLAVTYLIAFCLYCNINKCRIFNSSIKLIVFVTFGGFVLSFMNYLESCWLGGENIYHLLSLFEYRIYENYSQIYESSLDHNEIYDEMLGNLAILDYFGYLFSLAEKPLFLPEKFASLYYPEAYNNGWGSAFGLMAESLLVIPQYPWIYYGIVSSVFVVIMICVSKLYSGIGGGLVYAYTVPAVYKLVRTDVSTVAYKFLLDLATVAISIAVIGAVVRISKIRTITND